MCIGQEVKALSKVRQKKGKRVLVAGRKDEEKKKKRKMMMIMEKNQGIQENFSQACFAAPLQVVA